ncbi:copper amine oxidase 1-like [Folsomia candida]|nr:copper amine oxidase 1-like [Folsomia candida]
MAQHHQHIVALRLDTEIDGSCNTVETVDVVPLDGSTSSKANPYGQGFTVRKNRLETQGKGGVNTSSETGRVWMVINEGSVHPHSGGPVGYKLIPSNSPKLMQKDDSPILRPIFSHARNNLWVTRYKDGQIFAGGFYKSELGLPDWMEAESNSTIVNTDIVLWHVFNAVHVARAEDFPLMSAE